MRGGCAAATGCCKQPRHAAVTSDAMLCVYTQLRNAALLLQLTMSKASVAALL